MSRLFVYFVVLVVLVSLAACATTNTVDNVGSQAWYDARLAEITAARDAGDITTEEYLSLKGELDQIRATTRSGRSGSSPDVSFSFGVHKVIR